MTTNPVGPASSDSAEPIGDDVFDLRLYVAGQSPKSIRAVENLRRVCDEYLSGR